MLTLKALVSLTLACGVLHEEYSKSPAISIATSVSQDREDCLPSFLPSSQKLDSTKFMV